MGQIKNIKLHIVTDIKNSVRNTIHNPKTCFAPLEELGGT